MGILSTKEFWPRESKVRGTGQHHGNTASYSTFLYDAHILNGIGRCTERWVPMVEALTGQPNLHLLTALTWKQVISAQGPLRRRRAWCPACYAEWTTSQHIVYEPLLWALAAVSVCPRHGVRLVEVCPCCRQGAGALSGRWRAGYCSRCRRWLGSDRPPPESGGEDDRHRLWVAENIGALLARAAFLSILRKQMYSGRTFWSVSTISPMEIIVRWHEPFACMSAAFDAGCVEACQRLTP
jgi:hypothetical protein